MEKGLIIFSVIGAAISPYLGYTGVLFFIIVLIIKRKLNLILRNFKRNGFLLTITLFLFLNSINSKYSMYSFAAFGIIILQMFLYIGIRQYYKTDKENFQLLRGIVVGSIIISFIAIIQYFFLKPEQIPQAWIDRTVYHIQVRVYGTLYNPNVLAAYLVSIISMLITSLEEIQYRFLHFIALMLCSLSLLFTYSRGAWIALSFVLATIITLRKDKMYFLYAFIMFLLMIMIDGNNYVERMSPKMALLDGSLAYRLEIYKTSLKIFQDHYIMGTGINSMRKYINQYSTLIKAPVFHCHNILLHVMTETGLVGLSLFICYFIYTVKECWGLMKDTSEKAVKDFALGVNLLLLALLVQGISDAVLFAPQYSIFLCVILAIMNNLRDFQKQCKNKKLLCKASIR